MSWPPSLPDHGLLEPWRPMNATDLEELRAQVKLGPCEAIECVARDRERNVRQLVTQFRPVEVAVPDRDASYDAELLRTIGGDSRGWYPLPDEATTPVWRAAWALRAAGLVVIEPPPARLTDRRPTWRPAPADHRPWKLTLTERGRRELATRPQASLRDLLPGPEEVANAAEVAEDALSDVERATERLRTRWADNDCDALELERALEEALPQRPELGAPRTLLLVLEGRARAFERLPWNPKKHVGMGQRGGWEWRSMYVFSVGDVRRFAEGARR